jgi:hypothetical protein
MSGNRAPPSAATPATPVPAGPTAAFRELASLGVWRGFPSDRAAGPSPPKRRRLGSLAHYLGQLTAARSPVFPA